MAKIPSPSEIVELLQPIGLNEESVYYVNFHSVRFHYLLTLFGELTAKKSGPIKVLDIGPSFQTYLLRKVFPEVHIDTMGFDIKCNHLAEGERHYDVDLNYLEKYETPTPGQYDIILFCEVIEHLYSDPVDVLRVFRTWMKGDGTIVVQTPNAAAIHKRVMLLLGRNPYPLLEKDRMGHFREYTNREIKSIIQQGGFSNPKVHNKNYFKNTHNFLAHTYFKLGPILPPLWRDGMTIVAQCDR